MLRLRIRKIVEKTSGIKDFSLERKEGEKFGDYSSNVAFLLAKKAGGNPHDTAEELKRKLESKKLFKKVDVAGPGFLNFYVQDHKIAEHFYRLSKAKGLPRFTMGKGRKIQVEFISANPTGPLTLANGRGGFLGDVLSNVFCLGGFHVEREYYVNDTGNQIRVLGESLLSAVGILPPESHFYKGEYIKEWAKKNVAIVKRLKNDPLKLGERAAKDFLSRIKNVVGGKARIHFDRWTSEASLHKKSFVSKALTLFRKKGLVYEKDGATWLKTSDFGDDKDRVLVTSDHYPTYFLADSGHYLETVSRGFRRKINILGPDHYGYIGRIQAVAKIVGLKKSEIIVTQAIRVVKNGKEVTMSKRSGTFITFEELIGKIGLDSARYFFLARSPLTHIGIDINLAKKRSQENPVFYVQYAHARMASILRKAAKKPIKFAFNFGKAELDFIKKILAVHDVLEDTARDHQVHRLTNYAYEFAEAFSIFYRDVKVLGSDKDEPRRLFIIKHAKNILASLLSLMGISAPEKM